MFDIFDTWRALTEKQQRLRSLFRDAVLQWQSNVLNKAFVILQEHVAFTRRIRLVTCTLINYNLMNHMITHTIGLFQFVQMLNMPPCSD